ncbi:MAG TPA: aldehyde dehydrogenase family protein [Candidatus Eremiobacteraceae bacterium]|nr:aldehyde dehydrogenase family protein [Candidatus Eremiobacteraceae bacterium]
MTSRVAVRKTLKLYIAGAFVRSESGRTIAVRGADESVNVALASRKDVRDAVRAARGAWPAWRDRSAYNRGQILYRLAEMMESRRAQLIDACRAAGLTARVSEKDVDEAIDATCWYAGLSDKIEQIFSTKNPVSGPHFNVSTPESTGVVGVVAPNARGIAGLIAAVVPPLCGGNAVVCLASDADPFGAVALAESAATSDFPAGVLNILTGRRSATAPHLAAHMDVNALGLWDCASQERRELDIAASANVKRVAGYGAADRSVAQMRNPYHVVDFLEIKTTWHPAGL